MWDFCHKILNESVWGNVDLYSLFSNWSLLVSKRHCMYGHLPRCFSSISYAGVQGLNFHAYAHICGYVLHVEILTLATVSVRIYPSCKNTHSGNTRVQNSRCMSECYTEIFFQ